MLDLTEGLNGPLFVNENIEDRRLEILYDLLERVGDNQKELLEKEIKFIQIGLSGESNVIYELKHSKEKILVVHDVTIKDSYKDSQIDFLIISEKGLIVLETKKLQGDIEINGDGDFIRHYKNAEGKVYKKEGIYSPITQNKYHINALMDLLKENGINVDIPIYSFVVIANPKTIINKTYAKKEIKNKIIKYDQLNEHIEAIIGSTEYTMDISLMEAICNIVCKNNEPREYDYITKFNLELVNEPVKDIKIIDEEGKSLYDDTLYEALKAYRLQKAASLNYKLYFIFTNKELEELVLKRPHDKEDLLEIEGFGSRKLELYGDDILHIIAEDEANSLKEGPFSERLDNILYNKLKNLRYRLSIREDKKPYMIYTNSQMEEVVRLKPKSADELLSCPGFGRSRVEKYGDDVLGVINAISS